MSTETEHVHLQIDSARKYHVQSGLAEFVEMAIYGAAQRERESNWESNAVYVLRHHVSCQLKQLDQIRSGPAQESHHGPLQDIEVA